LSTRLVVIPLINRAGTGIGININITDATHQRWYQFSGITAAADTGIRAVDTGCIGIES
jgi:hypothetical protein